MEDAIANMTAIEAVVSFRGIRQMGKAAARVNEPFQELGWKMVS